MLSFASCSNTNLSAVLAAFPWAKLWAVQPGCCWDPACSKLAWVFLWLVHAPPPQIQIRHGLYFKSCTLPSVPNSWTRPLPSHPVLCNLFSSKEALLYAL